MDLDHATKLSVQAMISDKLRDKQKCETLKIELEGLKRSVEQEIKKWNTIYKKSQNNDRTKLIVKKGLFEGNKAKQIKSLYHGQLAHMNCNYIGQVIRVCAELEEQIQSIQTYINKLESETLTLNKKMSEIPD